MMAANVIEYRVRRSHDQGIRGRVGLYRSCAWDITGRSGAGSGRVLRELRADARVTLRRSATAADHNRPQGLRKLCRFGVAQVHHVYVAGRASFCI